MCNDNRSHAKEMVISVTFKYIISLPFASLCQPMASKRIPDGSRIAYSRRSYHLVTWQEALDIIIYLYRVIPRVTKLSPFVVQLPSSLSLAVFAHSISFLFMQRIYTHVYPFVPKQT